MSLRLARLRRSTVPLAVVLCVSVVAVAVAATRVDADRMAQKIEAILLNGDAERTAPRHTTVTERELNAFLSIHAREGIPAGVLDPAVKIGAAGHLTANAVVDLDEVRKARRAAGLSAPLLLTGRLPVQASGVLRTANGIGRFELREAWVSSIPIPRSLLQDIVAHYSRTPDSPDGIDLDAPFELPASIREIRTTPGSAVIVQ